MTDRELLEMAAKTAGIELAFDIEDRFGLPWTVVNGVVCAYWNPLIDDGDAFRLAVKLHFGTRDFCPTPDSELGSLPGMIEIWRETDEHPISVEWYKPEVDRYAATRRAIVRAAAKIGRNIKDVKMH